MYRDYAAKGVKFYYVYKTLAHPGRDGYVDALTIEDRLQHVRAAMRKLKGMTLPWLCDNMSNDLKKALGELNNSEFIFDPDGKIVRLRDWSSPTQLRADLEQLIGRIDKPTRVSDLRIRFDDAPRDATRGVTRRLAVPPNMRSIQVTPKDIGQNSYYAKLRAEATPGVLKDGTGKLYLEFRLDPVYRVHWNNLVAPIEFEIRAGEKTTVSPEKGQAAKVDHASDIDPREFLIDLQAADSKTPLDLTVRYFACSDDEGWCKPVTQSYIIHLKPDFRSERRNRRNGPRGRRGFGGIR